MIRAALEPAALMPALVIALGLTATTPSLLEAHQDPPGCLGIDNSMRLMVTRSDGSPVIGPVSECETLTYRAELEWEGECLIQGGRFKLVTPDGVEHVVTDPVPCLGDATVNAEGCTIGQDTSILSAMIAYTVDPADVIAGTLGAAAVWENGILHQAAGNVPGQGDMRQILSSVQFCDDALFCNGPEVCDPAATDGVRLGLCQPGTPANCGVADECTDRGCDEALDECFEVDASGRCGISDACLERGCDPESGCFENDLCPADCGNGTLDPGETCDPPGVGQPPFGNVCRADCTYCGDGLLQAAEQCDGTDLGGATCPGGSPAGGFLQCLSDCSIDFGNCSATTTTTTTSTTITTTTTTSSTSTSTTSTTLPPVECTPSPRPGCVSAASGLLVSKERRPGAERFKARLARFAAPVELVAFGDPVAGTSSYAVCVYDQTGSLAAQMQIARAGQTCGETAPCWQSVKARKYQYIDRLGEASGLRKVVMVEAPRAERGKIVVRGENNAARGRTGLPTGISAALAGGTHATVQVAVSDAGCFELVASDVRRAETTLFKALH